MGYSVDKVAGDAIYLNKEQVARFESLLDSVEINTGIGHISWCEPIDKLREHHEGRELVFKVLTDYGFIAEYDDNEDGIIVYSWGGDKIGSSWDPMWDALGEVASEKVVWLIRGEDNEFWAEVVAPGEGRRQVGIDLDELIQKAYETL
jgi:hypothetical protein